jgi:hypothetical protein
MAWLRSTHTARQVSWSGSFTHRRAKGLPSFPKVSKSPIVIAMNTCMQVLRVQRRSTWAWWSKFACGPAGEKAGGP